MRRLSIKELFKEHDSLVGNATVVVSRSKVEVFPYHCRKLSGGGFAVVIGGQCLPVAYMHSKFFVQKIILAWASLLLVSAASKASSNMVCQIDVLPQVLSSVPDRKSTFPTHS
ncbi:hypothetical protein TNCT_262231 [Trichonephila clavata]|uniref:Uncharacterized protein n=1 Tax=Trichonephila clavata TaxID=2740835 RepID=A0A8X6HVV4_TRICU|nr:hypothetical protein TNCT_262231 [Trichonephila clavata]